MYVYGSPKWVALDERSKFSLIFSTYINVSLGWTILASIMISTLTVIEKLTFQDFSHIYLNAKETQTFSIHFFFHMDHMRLIS